MIDRSLCCIQWESRQMICYLILDTTSVMGAEMITIECDFQAGWSSGMARRVQQTNESVMICDNFELFCLSEIGMKMIYCSNDG